MTKPHKPGTPARGSAPSFDLGDRLEKALRTAGVTHHEMAEYLGVSRNTIGNYVAMRTSVSDGTLRLWAFRTGVPMQWLKTGEVEPGQIPDQPRRLAHA